MADAKGFLELTTPLKSGVLTPLRISGKESLSELFEFELSAECTEADVEFGDIVGQDVSVALRSSANGDIRRYVSGVVGALTAGEYLGGNREVSITIVPLLSVLAMRSNCRVFQKETSKDIVEKIFSDYGFNNFRWDIKGEPPLREYCIQFNETDLAFVSRLLEEDGLSYYFEHQQSSHTLVLTDGLGKFAACDEAEVEHSVTGTTHSQITGWSRTQQWHSKRWTLRDYDFERPKVTVESAADSQLTFKNNSKLESYTYPGNFLDSAEGDKRTRHRLLEKEALHHVVLAESNCASFSHGKTFKVTRHENESELGEYLITSISLDAGDSTNRTGGGGAYYRNQFQCIPVATQFVPPRVHHKPQISGLQTAFVVGPGSEEIYTKNGMIKIQFHWDREGKKDQTSSCWVRVAQMWADKIGALFIFRELVKKWL